MLISACYTTFLDIWLIMLDTINWEFVITLWMDICYEVIVNIFINYYIGLIIMNVCFKHNI